MASVYKRHPEEPFEKLLKRFKKMVEQEQIISTYMRKQYYMKPSEWRKFKEHKSEMRRKKQLYKMKQKLKQFRRH